ncbi:Vacuolar protein sorting-associated protein 53 [Coemansia interrupta]|uniref:Vacuolar protein sorting-associated protein 53 n=1 Tax=Coemansia interrupta TaxID=1126814 RepID=A0A9W8HJ27_9FUNG|nr:Vacuolar protein sorting-associated protein 53 [Coemansia interrupta]
MIQRQTTQAGLEEQGHIDSMFPTAQSLEGIEVVSANMRRRLAELSDSMRTLLRAQADGDTVAGQQGISTTVAAIGTLYQRISQMRGQARTSERMVLDITQDIKALDSAKRNVTQTTTVMRRLQLLMASQRELQALTQQGRWEEAGREVLAVAGLADGLQGFERVPQVAQVVARAGELQAAAGRAAAAVVTQGFDAHGQLTGDAAVMRAACTCVQAVGASAQQRLTQHYCSEQLRAYSAIFQPQDDVSQLSHVSRRYGWLRRILRNFADLHAPVFPDGWRVAEHLARGFGELTRDQLANMMASTPPGDAPVLVNALADTLAFETQCDRKFGIVAGAGGGHVYEAGGEAAQSFGGLVACAFEPYLGVFRSMLVLNTADYCASMATQLEAKILERISAAHKSVSFAGARDALLGAVNRAIMAMVAETERRCAAAFMGLAKTPWHCLPAVGDQSAYVGELAAELATAVHAVHAGVAGPRYVRAYLDKLAVRLADRYMAEITGCQGVSEVGAEQLLLDAQALRSLVLALPATAAAGTEDKPAMLPSAAYARLVAQGIGRVEALLKALLAPADPPDALVDRFLLLFPQAPRDIFQQVLSLKRIRPPDQHAFHRLLQRMARDPPTAATATAAGAAAADPLGITVAAPTLDLDSDHDHDADHGADFDPANAPVLASLAANATATRSKINENLRKFMSNMRRN